MPNNEEQKTMPKKLYDAALATVAKIDPEIGNNLDRRLQNTGVDSMDWLGTIPRVAGVFACAYANGTYDPNPLLSDHHPLGVDGSDYVNSAFDRLLFHKDAQGNLHLTHAGMAMIGITGGVGFFSGVARGIYKHQHQKNLNSRKRLRTMMGRHLTEAEAKECATIEDEKESALAAFMKIDVLNEFQNEIKKFNADRKKNGEALTDEEKDRINQKFNATFQKLTAVPENKAKLDALIAAYQKQDIMDKAIVAAKTSANENSPYETSIVDGQFNIQRVRGSIFNKQDRVGEKTKRKGLEAFFHGITSIDNHRMSTLMSYPFSWMVNQSMWYWLAWLMALLIVGPVVISTSAPVIIALGAVAGGIGLIISAFKGVGRISKHLERKQKRADITKLLANDNADVKDVIFKESIVRMKGYYAAKLDALKDTEKKAAFLLTKYEKYKANDDAAAKGQLTAWKSRVFMNFEHEQNLKKIASLRTTLGDSAPSVVDTARIKAIKVPKKSIMGYLQPSKHETRMRIANNIIGAMAFGFVIPFFITQLLGGILSAVVVAGFGITILSTSTAIAGTLGVLNGAALSTIWGGLWAAKNGLTTFISQRNSKSAYQQKLDALNARVDDQPSKIEQFDALQKAYNKKLAYLQRNHPAVHAQMQATLVGSKHWSATNHHYHEKQRAKATPWTRIKQGMNRAYELIGGAETGVLVARVLFLSGCVLGFTLLSAATVALTGVTFGLAPVVFTVIAGVLGGILGVNRLLKYNFGKRQEHREKFIDTFDDRLKFLEQKNEEMDKLLGIAPVVVNDNPAAPGDERDQAHGVVPQLNASAQANVVVPSPVDAPVREEGVPDAITNKDKINEASDITPPNSDALQTPAYEKINMKPAVSINDVRHSLLFKPAVHPVIEPSLEHMPPAIALTA
jgi:hypothetical protein